MKKGVYQSTVLALGLILMTLCHASDSLSLKCSGVAASMYGSERIPLSVEFVDIRADDGKSRIEKTTLHYQSKKYEGRYLNETGAPANYAEITLLSYATQKNKIFEGVYTLNVKEKDSGNVYSLHLQGEFTLTPDKKDAEYFCIDATLPCTVQ